MIRSKQDTLFLLFAITCFYIYVFVFIVRILHFYAMRLVVLFFSFLSVTINIIYRISGIPHLKFWGQAIVAERISYFCLAHNLIRPLGSTHNFTQSG